MYKIKAHLSWTNLARGVTNDWSLYAAEYRNIASEYGIGDGNGLKAETDNRIFRRSSKKGLPRGMAGMREVLQAWHAHDGSSDLTLHFSTDARTEDLMPAGTEGFLLEDANAYAFVDINKRGTQVREHLTIRLPKDSVNLDEVVTHGGGRAGNTNVYNPAVIRKVRELGNVSDVADVTELFSEDGFQATLRDLFISNDFGWNINLYLPYIHMGAGRADLKVEPLTESLVLEAFSNYHL